MSKKRVTYIVLGIVFVSVITVLLFSLDVTDGGKEEYCTVDMIVSLGGGTGSRVKKAWELQEKGYSKSDKLLITGIPINPETVIHINPRLKYLKQHPEIHYIPVSVTEDDSTWEEALYLKRMMIKKHYKHIMIVTHPLHSGRVKMSLERVAHFKSSGLDYTIVGDRKIEFMHEFIHDEKFRNFALNEMLKRFVYEIKALF